jgi:hypothetical protein
MTFEPSNVWKMFYGAVLNLAWSTKGSIQERVVKSFHQYMWTFGNEELPEECRSEFSSVENRLAEIHPNTSTEELQKRLSDDDAQEIVATLLRIFIRIGIRDAGAATPGRDFFSSINPGKN